MTDQSNVSTKEARSHHMRQKMNAYIRLAKYAIPYWFVLFLCIPISSVMFGWMSMPSTIMSIVGSLSFIGLVAGMGIYTLHVWVTFYDVLNTINSSEGNENEQVS